MVSCENGHENRESRLFCADCGIPIVDTMAVCPLGHVNAKDQHFCGDCGIPIRTPGDSPAVSPSARWNVDPSGKHQYRFWDGVNWSQNVADNGDFSRDSFTRPTKWHPDTWVGVAAGILTLLLVVGAIVGIAMQLSGSPESITAGPASSSPSAAAPTPSAPAEPAAPPAPAAPATPAVRPVAVVGTPCLPNSTAGSTADGSIAYCSRFASTDTTMWSLIPGDIPPFPAGSAAARQNDPATGVCMTQTSRTAAQCAEYLQRPSDPGDGGAPAP